jgi:hypothetical protein
MEQDVLEVPCPHCRVVSESHNRGAGPWSCPNCGRTYVLRRCSECHLVSHVPVAQKRGDPWVCVWCDGSNDGYKRQGDPATATFAELADDVAEHNLAADFQQQRDVAPLLSAQFAQPPRFPSSPAARRRILEAIAAVNEKYARPFDRGRVASFSLLGTESWSEYGAVVLQMATLDTLLCIEEKLDGLAGAGETPGGEE